VNLLTKTEQFDDAIWLKARSAAANTTATTDPLGGNTADKLTEDTQTGAHYVANPSGSFMATAVSYTFSCAIKAAERTFAALGTGELGAETGFPAAGIAINLTTGAVTATNGTFSASSVTSLGNGWWRCSITVLGTTSTGRFWVAMAQNGSSADISAIGYTGDSTSGIYIWGADLRPSNDGVGLPPYQYVNTPTDYDSGPEWPRYLRFDGIDDGMVTGTITPGADKAQVFAGVRKLSDAAAGMLVELTSGTGNGRFYVSAPDGASSNYGFSLTGAAATERRSSAYAAPTSNVLSCTFDFAEGSTANEKIRPRVNGAVGIVSSSVADPDGTAFLAAPLFIGRRGGASLPFSGRLYPLIVRFGPTLTAEQIAQTETWVNGKTRAYA
jgi:hypothetical protein